MVGEQLRAYLDNNFSTSDKFELIKANDLVAIMEKYYCDYPLSAFARSVKSSNHVIRMVKHRYMIELIKDFNYNHITILYFKGEVLQAQLYDDLDLRSPGDIDIYVASNRFIDAMSILEDHGFLLDDNNVISKDHHSQYKKGHIKLELHKNLFNPFTRIDETYLRTNTHHCRLGDEEVLTFSTTATLLHLIYHLYMDYYLACESLYQTLVKKSIPKAKRFLYRAYEIALFSEKYYSQIKWEDMIEDIKKQSFRIIFKKMIKDILNIFPTAFSDEFIYAVYRLNYIRVKWDGLYDDLIETDESNIDKSLCTYIDSCWDSRSENNIRIQIGDSFMLPRDPKIQQIKSRLLCTINTQLALDGIELIFSFSDDDFCFSDAENFDTLSSDGVHLLLCGTKEYSYSSIFLFPKIINGEIKVVACDILYGKNTVFNDNLIRTTFAKTENGYMISCTLSNAFLIEKHLNSYFYMGLVISDCCSKTHFREDQLILSDQGAEWYNPIYFAKVSVGR